MDKTNIETWDNLRAPVIPIQNRTCYNCSHHPTECHICVNKIKNYAKEKNLDFNRLIFGQVPVSLWKYDGSEY